MAWKKETQTSIAARLKRISDKAKRNSMYVIDTNNVAAVAADMNDVIADGKPKPDDIYDYYLDKGMYGCPWFEQYRQKRYDAANEWDRLTGMYNVSNTEDEQAYHTRRYYRETGKVLGIGENVNKTF